MDGDRLLRALRAGAVAAALGGLVNAALTRVLMRVVRLLTDQQPEFTVGGTVGIAVFYVVLLLPGAVLLAYGARRAGWVLYAAGVGLLVFVAVGIGLQETEQVPGLSVGRWVLLLLTLAAMVFLYAAQVVVVARSALRAGHLREDYGRRRGI
jgi:hypothetical protein